MMNLSLQGHNKRHLRHVGAFLNFMGHIFKQSALFTNKYNIKFMQRSCFG